MLGQQISIRVTPAELKRLRREAGSRSVTISNYVRRAIYEFLGAGDDSPQPLFLDPPRASAPSGRGGEGESSAPRESEPLTPTRINHVSLARRDEQIAFAIESQADRISRLREEISVLSTMVDRAYFGYLAHTPEIDPEFRAAAVAGARRRHDAWRGAVEEYRRHGPRPKKSDESHCEPGSASDAASAEESKARRTE